jgi:hypothetical protein
VCEAAGMFSQIPQTMYRAVGAARCKLPCMSGKPDKTPINFHFSCTITGR